MHKTCKAVDGLKAKVGKGGLSQTSFVMEDPRGAVIKLSCSVETSAIVPHLWPFQGSCKERND